MIFHSAGFAGVFITRKEDALSKYEEKKAREKAEQELGAALEAEYNTPLNLTCSLSNLQNHLISDSINRVLFVRKDSSNHVVSKCLPNNTSFVTLAFGANGFHHLAGAASYELSKAYEKHENGKLGSHAEAETSNQRHDFDQY
ncbi:hypothetical protein M378DRAFT_10996 [Amanita muscaria Koide BX008]|uniref:Uncharacterized protein n=1 Tax=Amanita muscaria (strain Koide BX008) TaxID=946122 RepID=A0A0C2X8P2_AMAMK|nr:hypothetical protein M378DRAFT_10996 [Amanita muscaria Koide BX008]